MKQTTAPRTPSPTKQATKPVAKVELNKNPRTEFFAAAMNMSWQLAAVVLAPVIGGFELDKKLGLLPLLTITGFVIAMIGMSLVVWRQLQLYSPPAAHHGKGSRS